MKVARIWQLQTVHRPEVGIGDDKGAVLAIAVPIAKVALWIRPFGSTGQRDVNGAALNAQVLDFDRVNRRFADSGGSQGASATQQGDWMTAEVLLEARAAGGAHRIDLSLTGNEPHPCGDITVADVIVLPCSVIVRSCRTRSGKLHIVFVMTVTSP